MSIVCYQIFIFFLFVILPPLKDMVDNQSQNMIQTNAVTPTDIQKPEENYTPMEVEDNVELDKANQVSNNLC